MVSSRQAVFCLRVFWWMCVCSLLLAVGRCESGSTWNAMNRQSPWTQRPGSRWVVCRWQRNLKLTRDKSVKECGLKFAKDSKPRPNHKMKLIELALLKVMALMLYLFKISCSLLLASIRKATIIGIRETCEPLIVLTCQALDAVCSPGGVWHSTWGRPQKRGRRLLVGFPAGWRVSVSSSRGTAPTGLPFAAAEKKMYYLQVPL